MGGAGRVAPQRPSRGRGRPRATAARAITSTRGRCGGGRTAPRRRPALAAAAGCTTVAPVSVTGRCRVSRWRSKGRQHVCGRHGGAATPVSHPSAAADAAARPAPWRGRCVGMMLRGRRRRRRRRRTLLLHSGLWRRWRPPAVRTSGKRTQEAMRMGARKSGTRTDARRRLPHTCRWRNLSRPFQTPRVPLSALFRNAFPNAATRASTFANAFLNFAVCSFAVMNRRVFLQELLVAGGVTCAMFAVYSRAAYPTVAGGDSGELVAEGYELRMTVLHVVGTDFSSAR